MNLEAQITLEIGSEFLHQRSHAIITGAAIGDTLGMPIEGWTPELISKYLGRVNEPMSGPQVHALTVNHPDFNQSDFPKNKFLNRQLEKGEWTDDTMLFMAVAEGIIRAGGYDLRAVADTHIELFKKIKDIDPDGGWGAFGKTTLTALESLSNGTNPKLSGVSRPGATGNGPALKTASIGFHAFKTGTYNEGLQFAKEVSEMTHKNPASVASGIVQAHAVFDLLSGAERNNFLANCVHVSRWMEEYKGSDYDYLTPKLAYIWRHQDSDDTEIYDQIGNRFAVTQSYPFALFMFNKYWDNPLEGMIATVNMGGDADSTGAILGALAGARGFEFPKDWQNALNQKDNLNEVANALVQIR